MLTDTRAKWPFTEVLSISVSPFLSLSFLLRLSLCEWEHLCLFVMNGQAERGVNVRHCTTEANEEGV